MKVAEFGILKFGKGEFGTPEREEKRAGFGILQFGKGGFGIEKITEEITPRPILAFGLSGRVGRPEWPDPEGVYGIYQMRMTKRGKVPYKMKFYRPTNPRTPAQQENRQKFAQAMAEWQSLTEEQKLKYNKEARKINLFGRNLFIREYYQKNKSLQND